MPGATQKAPKKTKYTRPERRNSVLLSEHEEERLDKYIAAIKGVRVDRQGFGSVPDLLQLVARSQNHARLRTNLMKAIKEDEVIGELFPAAILTDEAESQCRINMATEVEKLATMPIFGQYTPEAIDTILDTDNKTIIKELQLKAPSLWALLFHLCQTTDKTPEDKKHAQIISIVSNICYAKHPRLCNLLPAVMGLLLQSSGAKRHIYSITNNLGWTESYQSTLRSVKGLKEKTRQRIKDRIKEGPCGIVYDNCDLSLGVSEQSDTKQGQLISITSALLVPIIGNPEGGLKQSHFNIDVPLELGDITKESPGDASIREKITVAIVWDALRKTFPDILERKLKNATERIKNSLEWPAIEPLEILPAHLRKPVPLMPIQLSENTTANNIAIIDNILIEQLGMTEEEFKDRKSVV